MELEAQSIDDIMWDLLEKVTEGLVSVERARYIMAGSGRLNAFDEALEILTEGTGEKK